MGEFEAKDEVLARLARSGNIARFVSFAPDGTSRHVFLSNKGSAIGRALIDRLLVEAESGSVNIRTWSSSGQNRSLPFVTGLRSADEVWDSIRSFHASGLFALCNETIELNDGGVSGVSVNDWAEVAPGRTPRAVEEAGSFAAPVEVIASILSTILQYQVSVPASTGDRIEFSVHPRPRGLRGDRTILWATEPMRLAARSTKRVRWPNDLSRMIGDKAFGLMVAARWGAVPRTHVVCRDVPPFQVGEPTGRGLWWTRSAPRIPKRGYFPTERGRRDPFEFVAGISESAAIGALITQEEVAAEYSGAAYVDATGAIQVEGVRGFGNQYMTGDALPEPLPPATVARVETEIAKYRNAIGDCRIEWADDGARTWTLQLHCDRATLSGDTVSPGDAASWLSLDMTQPLEDLRQAISRAPAGAGFVLLGDVGYASHKMELVLDSGRPARFG